MRIALFSDNFYPELSGITDSLLCLSRELARAGHTVGFFVPRYSTQNFRRSNLPPIEISIAPGVTIQRLPSLPFPTGTEQGRLVIPWPSLVKQVAAFKPDIIHTHLFFGVGLVALRAARELQIPLLGTNHTLFSEFMRLSPIGKRALPKIGTAYVRWYYNHCQQLTTPATSLRTAMIADGVRPPITVMDNPIDTDIFALVSPEQKTAYKKQWECSGPTAVYAGRLSGEKNVAAVIDAFALVTQTLPNATLMIAGHGSLQSALTAKAQSLPCHAHIRFVGTLDKPTLASLYGASDLFVTASPSENQPLTLLQAMATGLPAVGVRAGGLAEYIQSEYGALVDVGDVPGLAREITRYLQNEKQRASAGASALAASTRFSSATVSKKWLNLYASLLKKA